MVTYQTLTEAHLYLRLAKDIENQIFALEPYRSPTWDHMPTQSNRSPQEEYLDKIEILEKKLLKRRSEFLERWMQIEIWLETVNDLQVESIVRRRFFLGDKWEAIAREVCHSTNPSTPIMLLKRFLSRSNL